jgi:hypothetical protein
MESEYCLRLLDTVVAYEILSLALQVFVPDSVLPPPAADFTLNTLSQRHLTLMQISSNKLMLV